MTDELGTAPKVETPAQKMAARLRNLAAHLEAHPNLNTMTVHSQDFGLQLGGYGRCAERDLLDWADTMADSSCEVQFYKDKLEGECTHIRVTGTVGTHQETVWDAISGFAAWLRANGVVEPDVVHVKDFNLDLLRQFADEAGAARQLVSSLDESGAVA